MNDALRDVFPGCPEMNRGYAYPNDKPGLELILMKPKRRSIRAKAAFLHGRWRGRRMAGFKTVKANHQRKGVNVRLTTCALRIAGSRLAAYPAIPGILPDPPAPLPPGKAQREPGKRCWLAPDVDRFVGRARRSPPPGRNRHNSVINSRRQIYLRDGNIGMLSHSHFSPVPAADNRLANDLLRVPSATSFPDGGAECGLPKARRD